MTLPAICQPLFSPMTNNNFWTINNDRGDPLVDLNIPNIGNPNDSRRIHICLSFESRLRVKYQLLQNLTNQKNLLYKYWKGFLKVRNKVEGRMKIYFNLI